MGKVAHYDLGGVESIDVVKQVLTAEEYEGFLKGNLLKYLCRAGRKPGNPKTADYHKAADFACRLAHGCWLSDYHEPRKQAELAPNGLVAKDGGGVRTANCVNDDAAREGRR